jgi:acetyltransferase-like isoleucine patch superfamily enzyme
MYSFSSFYSTESAAFFLDFASGNYGHSNFLTGLRGKIKVGKYVILEATNLICTGSIEINDHCMFSWGSVVMDSMLSPQKRDIIERRKLLEEAANSDIRFMEYNFLKPVIIEENVWVGFGAVIMPGVKLGKGCIIGCKTIVYDDVPPYAVVVGQPPRIIRYLTPAKKS